MPRNQISPSSTLEEVLRLTVQERMVAEPIGSTQSPWLTLPQELFTISKAILGKSQYRARKGITTDLNGLYWIRILNKSSHGLLEFENIPSVGRNIAVKHYRGFIEDGLVFPLVRGRDIGKFAWEFTGTYTIVPQQDLKGIPESKLRVEFVWAHKYFRRFKKVLSERSSYRRFLKPAGAPYYCIFDVGPYTFSPFKVVWREIQRDFAAAVLSPVNDPFVGQKPAIPDHKLFFVPLDLEDEAHYLCALLNSVLIKRTISAYAVETQVATHPFEYINIPKYDPKIPTHVELAKLSLQAHSNGLVNDSRLSFLAEQAFKVAE
jgi:hypothetical protein